MSKIQRTIWGRVFCTRRSRREGSESWGARRLCLEPLEDRRLLSFSAPADELGLSRSMAAEAPIKDGTFAPGEILIGFEGDLSASYNTHGAGAALKAAEKLVGREGLHSGRVLMHVPAGKDHNARLATCWKLPPGADVQEMVDRLAGRPGIAYAEPNYAVSIDTLPNDTRFAELWGMNNTGQTGGSPDADIDAPEAWEIAKGANQLVVGVIDTGVDYQHRDLAANIWTNPGEIPGDGIDNDGNGRTDDVRGWDFYNDDNNPMDDNGHGTHTSGTIGAVGNNALGVVGVNWNVQIMPLKFLGANGGGYTDDAVAAVDYATWMRTHGIDIVLTSNSWGGGGYSQALYDAINAGAQADMLFVASAGNSGSSVPSYPAGYDLDNIISVAATDHNDATASFSNWGAASVDLGAPGVDILSTMPRNKYALKSGTSMAAPHVSGVAALAWSLSPQASYQTIRDAIFAGVDKIPALDAAQGSLTPVATGGRLNAVQTLKRIGMVVCETSPVADQVIKDSRKDFIVDFSFPVDSTLLSGSGFQVSLGADTYTANSYSWSQNDPDTVTFHFGTSPLDVWGEYTMSMDEGAVTAAPTFLDHPKLQAWSANFHYYDPAGITVSKTSLMTCEDAMTPPDKFTVVLDAEPLKLVKISVTSNNLNEGTVDPLILEFGSANWSTPQTVSVRGVDDSLHDGNVGYAIELKVVPSDDNDPRYAALAPVIVPAVNIDNELTPVSWWTADGTLRDVAGPNNGILSRGASFTQDRNMLEDNAFAFDGVDDYFEAPTANLPTGNNDRTLELWFCADSFPSSDQEAYLAGYGAFGSSSQTYHLGTTGNRLFFSQWGTGVGGPALAPNQWYHVAVTNHGNDVILYLDGTEVSRTSVPINTPPNTRFFMGRIPGELGNIRRLDGTVDEVTVYDRALSTAEIGEIYRGTSVKHKPPGIRISPANALAGLLTHEAQSEPQMFAVSLTEAPSAGVTVSIDVSTSDLSEGRVSQSSDSGWVDSVRLTFDSGNFALPQGVYVQGQDDAEADLDVAYTIVTAPAVAKVGDIVVSSPYNGFDADDIPVINIDDDWTTKTYVSTDVGKTIVDARTTLFRLTIPDQVVIVDLDVEVDISHTFDADLRAFLVAPDGTTRVELFTNVGGSGDNFIDTILDDEAALSISQGLPPFSGRYRPEDPLGLAKLDGNKADGMWTLEVTDVFRRDRGVLNAWQITVTYAIPYGTGTSETAEESRAGVSATSSLSMAASSDDLFSLLAAEQAARDRDKTHPRRQNELTDLALLDLQARR